MAIKRFISIVKKTIKANSLFNRIAMYSRAINEINRQQEINKNFKWEFELFISLSEKNTNRFSVKWEDVQPIYEKTKITEFDRHYVYHTSWAARCLSKTKPEKHVDISSSLFFSGICSAFTNIECYDYRKAELFLDNLNCKSADLINLPFEVNSIKSLSCMHTIEHIGLGRYGDVIDPNGDLKAINELKRVLAIGGNLFFVVPIGKPIVVFNAHRIYSHEQIMSYFKELKLVEFGLIPDNAKDGGLVYNPQVELINRQNCGCACYWFMKNS